jgi:hypothetical protein
MRWATPIIAVTSIADQTQIDANLDAQYRTAVACKYSHYPTTLLIFHRSDDQIASQHGPIYNDNLPSRDAGNGR